MERGGIISRLIKPFLEGPENEMPDENRRRELTRSDLERAEEYGGSDYKDWQEYSKKDPPSCDKGAHRLRSLENDPRPEGHIEYWKKKNKQRGG